MVAVLQRVERSKVTVKGQEIALIGRGFNILLGVFKDDTQEDALKLVNKIVKFRVFSDECGKMNLNIQDIGGSALVVSQFTLAGNVKKGNRPSFTDAKEPKEAKELYLYFAKELSRYIEVKTGQFGALMSVEIVNDGPVTFILNSKEL